MPVPKPIVVKYNDLHQSVKEKVAGLVEKRLDRAVVTGVFSPFSLAAGMTVKVGAVKGRAEAVAAAMALASPLAAYKVAGPEIRDRTSLVGEAVRRMGVLDKKGEIKVEKVRQTHPFAYVNSKGDIVLVPATRLQKALAKAQETFLRHAVPGRQRMRL